ncbi:hypothetical protein A9Q79_09920 [Methylophaga sp. 42_25_T18]|nr:hypothetical protein A9Q79_09920 [Methylophaga sp. 42_25_T18]OUR88846.1 hypothetical protein A9Q92_02060 [Methylophaga sp. 42_8_T64]
MNEALNSFLAEHERKAFRMAQLAVGNADDAHDIVQDAMIKLVNKYGTRTPQEWAPLFHRIMQHQITSWYRRQQLQHRWFPWFNHNAEDVEDNATLQHVQDPAGRSPDELLGNQQAMNKLEQAMTLLPLRQKQAFLCRCLQGLSTDETASAMACSTGSVKTHYHRALKALREHLGEVWP